MNGVTRDLDELFLQVTKPGRYIDREWNACHKDFDKAAVRVVLAYPDTYEIGMSNLGLAILYEILNQRTDVLAERVYAPWIDLEEKLRQEKIALFSLESKRPIKDFDLVGFSLQYEMTYTNILNLLDLAGIPFYTAERSEAFPLVIAGGPGVFNPEPLAPFFDLFVIGEAEEVIHKIVDKVKEFKEKGAGSREQGADKEREERREEREKLLMELAQIPGIYVPSLYQVEYDPSGPIVKFEPVSAAVPKKVEKQIAKDFSQTYYPYRPIVPFVEATHDRCSLEIMRGCTRGCRFCQAGMIYRPTRERPVGFLREAARQVLKNTGYEEISLVSLSSSDYTSIQDLLSALVGETYTKGISISLPSLRPDAFSLSLAREISRVKKTGLTFAPEAGTQRLRQAINKQLTEEEFLTTVRSAFRSGWRKLKLYFMIGLPTEKDEDLEGIVELGGKALSAALEETPPRERSKVSLTLNISTFVPKAHTPYQWSPQEELEEVEQKQEFLKRNVRGPRLSLKWHDSHLSFLEGVISRGDRRLAAVIERAFRLGCRFDGWSEYFRFELWLEAFRECGIDPAYYLYRPREKDEILPWEKIDAGLSSEFLWEEYQRTFSLFPTLDCRWNACHDCGVCKNLKIRPILEKDDLGCQRFG